MQCFLHSIHQRRLERVERRSVTNMDFMFADLLARCNGSTAILERVERQAASRTLLHECFLIVQWRPGAWNVSAASNMDYMFADLQRQIFNSDLSA